MMYRSYNIVTLQKIISLTITLAAIAPVSCYIYPFSCFFYCSSSSRKSIHQRQRQRHGAVVPNRKCDDLGFLVYCPSSTSSPIYCVGRRSAFNRRCRPWSCGANLLSMTTNFNEEMVRSDSVVSRRQTLSMMILGAASSSVVTVGTVSNLNSCSALEPQEASSAYDQYAPSYDTLDGGPIASFLELDQARMQLLSNARGRVLEIGVGTGLNIDKYPLQDSDGGLRQNFNNISSFVFVDISAGMLKQAKNRAASYFYGNSKFHSSSNVDVQFIQADATSSVQMLDLFGRHSFDTIVDTFTLCVLGNEGALHSLQVMKELLADQGQILLLENSRANNPLLGWYQDQTAAAIASALGGGKGCLYNQNVSSLLHKAGLSIVEEKSYVGGLFRAFVCVAR